MTRTWNNFKKLRHGIDKVDNLRDEEQQKCLGEMSVNANHRKSHSREVTVSVSHKYFGREPVVLEQSEGHSDEWHYQSD